MSKKQTPIIGPRAIAPSPVDGLAASIGDMPESREATNSVPDATVANIANVLALVSEECIRVKEQSDEAKASGNHSAMYRHNTALHSLWALATKIRALHAQRAE